MAALGAAGAYSPAANSVSGSSSPEANLDKMIQHQLRMFTLEIKKEMAKSEHDMMMSTAKTMGQAAEKA